MSILALPRFGTPAGELAAATLILLLQGVVIGAAELWHRRSHPPVEWTRKLIHTCTGLLAMSFPWLFSSHWTVLALIVLGGAPLLWMRSRGWLPSLFGVERRSFGEVYFPIAVYALFLVARRQPVFYLISMITLVVCDALAAVLGRAYGRHRYVVISEHRSIEGSIVFLFTSFLGVHLPLLLLTDLDRGACVVVAAQLALLVTSFEAIGAGGVDNLLVPIGTYYLLLKLTAKPVENLAVQLAVQLGILLAMLAIARLTRFLSFSGAIAAHLVLYAAFSLGGPAWIAAPCLALAAAMVLENTVARAVNMTRGGHHVRVIYYVSVVAVLLIFADNTFATFVRGAAALRSGHPFHALFVGSLAGALAIIAFWSFEAMPRVRRRSDLNRAVSSAALGYGVVAPLGLWLHWHSRAGVEFATAAAVCVAALALFLLARRSFRNLPDAVWNLRFLALSVLVATLAVLPLHFRWIGIRDWGRG